MLLDKVPQAQLERRAKVLRMAVQEREGAVSTAQRAGMGVRLPLREGDLVFVG